MDYTNAERAFLHMITVSEIGPELMALDPNGGYGVIVGSTPEAPDLFSDFSKHPGKLVYLPSLGISSTAAGAFQIIQRFAESYMHQLQLGDFNPTSQDRIAYQMLSETGAVPLINQGDIAGAIHLARSRWASFPGAGYGQAEHDMDTLVTAYNDSLAQIEAESGGNTV